MNDEITMMQATAIMDTIAQKLCSMIGRTCVLTDEDMSNYEFAGWITNNVNEVTRECFCEICDILDITKVKEA